MTDDLEDLKAMLLRAGIRFVVDTFDEENEISVLYVEPDLFFGDNKAVRIGFDGDGKLMGMAPF